MIVAFPLRVVAKTNDHVHWRRRAARTKAERTATAWQLIGKSRPELPVVVTLTRIAPSRFDDDNLPGALKSVRDQVAEWLGVDDRDPLVTWLYAQERGAVREHAVRIQVEARLGATCPTCGHALAGGAP